MKLTITEIQGTKYVQIYLTEEELQKKEKMILLKVKVLLVNLKVMEKAKI